MILRVLWSKPVELSELSIRRTTPISGGVYVVWPSWPNTTSRTPIYVGSAHDLQRRMLDHLSGAYGRGLLPSFDDGNAIFQFAPLDDAMSRKSVTAYLHDELRPWANRRRPAAPVQRVNLPADPWSLVVSSR